MKLVEVLPEMVNDLAGALVQIGRGDVVDQLREVSIEQWTYDECADAVYVYVQSPRQLNVVDRNIVGVKHGETLSLYDELGINIDFDNHHRVVGVEILGAKQIADVLARIAV
jgi:uncharacterized protein YuzE